MVADPVQLETKQASSNNSRTATILRQLIEQASQLLPAQGPITAFVFLNTLQGLEGLSFDDGVQLGGKLFGCQPYLPEERFREKFANGRITAADLTAAIQSDLMGMANAPINGLTRRIDLRQAMLMFPLREAPASELRWFIAETDALTTMRAEVPGPAREQYIDQTKRWVMRDVLSSSNPFRKPVWLQNDNFQDLITHYDTNKIESWSAKTWEAISLQILWRVCRAGVATVTEPLPQRELPIRHRDLLNLATGEDSDDLVHEVLVRFSAAMTDQGFAEWLLPTRELGFYQAFLELYRQGSGSPDRWLKGLSAELNQLAQQQVDAYTAIEHCLHELNVPESEWKDYIIASLIALRGWAGLIQQMDERADRVPVPLSPGALSEFLAVRLILEKYALKYVAATEFQYTGSLANLREAARRELNGQQQGSQEQRVFNVFQLAQVLGWTSARLLELQAEDWATLVSEIEAFDSMERRRNFQMAFEGNYRQRALDTFANYMQRDFQRVKQPKFQAVFCVDTREESFRRHLEELEPRFETFGAAGFFVVPIYYKGVADAHYSTLCPIVIRPQHWVTEEVVITLEDANRRRAQARKAIGNASRRVHVGSRSVAGGAILTAGLGVLASVPLVARVLFPRLTAAIRKRLGKFVEPPLVTRLRLERTAEKPSPDEDGIGFSLAEMANTGERMLKDIGLIESFARLVMFIGHGSFCLNNPHKSAYDCGACSGGAGGPNARALAMMLNDRRVRAILAERGIKIPDETHFLGGLHNTCRDAVEIYDLDLLPTSHYRDLNEVQELYKQACANNALERCRRFQSAPLNLSPELAMRHVENRSEDLSQTRPEFGNCTNAMCFVGRRERTRNLYMDRRCFLHSYNPLIDTEDSQILTRILGAVVPVCEGINLQYYFSYVDSPGWGSGTKLPHNITSLLGVMDGMASDMRTGLPWQGVEIHEPMRLLMIFETTPQRMQSIMDRNETVRRIIQHGWVQLVLLDPHSAKLHHYQHGEFVPYQANPTEIPVVDTSRDWYRGWRQHLGFAMIDPQRSAEHQEVSNHA
jgi:uncharacterized protein YbcC (UPF0753/DUF2309 family)